jgi:hypothetical protein
VRERDEVLRIRVRSSTVSFFRIDQLLLLICVQRSPLADLTLLRKVPTCTSPLDQKTATTRRSCPPSKLIGRRS